MTAIYSKTAVKDRVTELVFTLRARNSEFLFLVSREMFDRKKFLFYSKNYESYWNLKPVCLSSLYFSVN